MGRGAFRRPSGNGNQTHFKLANITQIEAVERMMRSGVCNVPLILTWGRSVASTILPISSGRFRMER